VPRRLRAWLEGTTGVVEVSGGAAPIVHRIPDVPLWWPHTHGEPQLHPIVIDLDGAPLDCGRVGFRTVELDRERGDRAGDGFALRINGVPIFCRGALWMPLDPVSLDATRGDYRAAMTQVRDAGMNMLRVAGTLVYEHDAFLDLADELGILVWQDLMFANMDYPAELPVETEIRQELARWQGRPSLAVVCGNSEVEQQAAMWGAGREHWTPRLFHEVIPPIVADAAPGVPYWPSSAHGGAFPHVADVGTTSYYGVGAYLRPLEDARRAELRFATECLAFANVGAGAPGPAHTPRDLGASWDFADVRDHYVARLFRVDPAELRATDPERYLALGRVATGEVMAATFGEWRRARSTCHGALVLSLRDLWPGGGWGLVDAAGHPKAAYHYCRRALAPLAVHLSDEGGNGLAIHVVNDRPAPVAGELALELWRDGEVSVGRASRELEVPARAAVEIPAVELLDGFTDLTYAYRFGPPPCDLVIVRFAGAEAFHFPIGLPNAREDDLGLVAELRGDDLVVSTRRYAQSVSVMLPGFTAEDDFFHVGPGAARVVRLRPHATPPANAPRGTVRPLNAHAPVVLRPG
jgi:beta-mannosidase